MVQGTHTAHRAVSPRLFRQQSSQEASGMDYDPTSPSRPATVNTATSPLSSPTRFSRQSTFDAYSPPVSPPDTPPHHQAPSHSGGFYRTHRVEKVSVGTSMVTTASTYTHGSMSMDNISLCRISTVPGTSRVEQGHMVHGGSVVDLRAPLKSAPIIMTDQGMDLTSLATDSRRYLGSAEGSPIRHSTIFQPLIMNLNAQEQPHVMASTPTTVSVTVAASMFISQHHQPVIYGDPLQNRVDLGQGMVAVCLAQTKPAQIDPTIPKIDAKLEDLSIQQEQLRMQQQKLQQQQQQLEQQLQQHHQLQNHQQSTSFARFNLSNQPPLQKKDLMVSQTSSAQPVVSAISPGVAPEMYSTGAPLEMQTAPGVVNLATTKPHAVMVQMDGTAQGAPFSQLVKPEEGQGIVDLTGQIKPENQVACCDVVYNLPFGGSCVGGPFSQKPSAEEAPGVNEPPRPPSAPPQLYQQIEIGVEAQPYQDISMKSYTLPFPGRLQPSMSDTNLADLGLSSFHSKVDPHLQAPGELAVDLSAMKDQMGIGLQYGSYTDLRHQGDVTVAPLPIRRYNSLSNISADYGYSARDLRDFQESNLAQYSATTAREISRMCAALNSIDRYASNPELAAQFGAGRGSVPPGRISLPQGLAALRPNLMYGPDGKPISHSQALTNLINARQASLRALYPSAIRSADGMTFSTINTPIASTVPITTQPASVLRPLLRGVYRPYPTPNMMPVPLASLTRMPVMTPRIPMSGQGPCRFPAPSQFPATTATAFFEPPPMTTVQDAPMYLGKSPVSSAVPGTVTAPILSGAPAQGTQPTSVPGLTPVVVPTNQPQEQPMNLTQPHHHTQTGQGQAPSQPQAPTQPQPPMAHAYPPTHGQPLSQPQSQPPPATPAAATTTSDPPATTPSAAKDPEEERLQRQQEHLLQLERECVELEKLRQLRLQEELERERGELQRQRDKEQILVQQEIQDLQSIKHHVLQQQQAEREKQLVMQREQLSQQKAQLDQIQSLQHQLQQQLEEQKRQKTAAVAAAAAANVVCDQTGRIIQQHELVPDMQYDAQMASRSLPNSASEMCLREEQETRAMRKQRSMPRLQDGSGGETVLFPPTRRNVDSSVQTDEEDGEERYLMSRRRRTRRSVDCSVQTDDDEDKAEWEQPVRRRRSRHSRHSESGADAKNDSTTTSTSAAAKVTSSSIAIQTIRDGSCQTDTEQLGRVSPAIQVTVPDPNRVEIVHYISGPERTQKGQSLACQTDAEAQSQGVVVPQISVATTISPYSTSVQLVGSSDPLSSRQQAAKFERRRPDPLEISYQQNHLHNESLSNLIRQPPKSPQVLYSPVSPLASPHRLIETSFASSERLNKAHVTPQQKSYTAESPQRHSTLPRPMKNVQRSMSDPKPLSPTTEDHAKARLSLYHQQALQSQVGIQVIFLTIAYSVHPVMFSV